MSYADNVFISMCEDILNNGVDTKGEKVRPHWEDGSEAYTIKKFGVVNKYDLSKEFPAITLRKVPIKSCVSELLWIWQKKSNNIKDLNLHIWDSWADESGSIGKAYGYQLGVLNRYTDITESGLMNAFKDGKFIELDDSYSNIKKVFVFGGNLSFQISNNGSTYWLIDQVNRVIYDLKNTPYSRRIMTNIYNHRDLSEMRLYPCAYSMTFNVTNENGVNVLNGILNQRSQDVLAANAWNVCQYAVLLHMLARECDMKVGTLIHVIADCHIYDRHIPIIENLIKGKVYGAPSFWLNPDKHDFYSFTKDDVRLDNYNFNDFNEKIPVAV